MQNENQALITRGAEIKAVYFDFLDKHVSDVVSGKVDEFMEINQI